jgi:hypothetical protein
MKKSLIALAIAGAMTVPAIVQADVTLSGVVEAQVTKTTDADTKVAAGDVQLNVAGSQDLGGGLTAFANVRFDGGLSTGTANVTSDSVKLGVSGDFGTLTFGETGIPAEASQLAGDLHDAYDDLNSAASYATTIADGVNFSVAVAPKGSDDTTSVGISFAVDAVTFGLGHNNVATSGKDAAGYGIKYAEGDISLAVAAADVDNSQDIVSGKATYSVDDLTFAVTYSSEDSIGTTTYGSDKTRFEATYALGTGTSLNLRSTTTDSADPAVKDKTETRLLYSVSF